MNIALYFGSFNPIHFGHISIAKALLNLSEIDRVWFVVSPHNPLKDSATLADQHHRLEMVELSIAQSGLLGLASGCDIEFAMARPSYTIDTLRALATKYPSVNFSIVMGGDNIVAIERWKEYSTIVDNYTIYVYPRQGYKRVEMARVVYLDNLPLYDISSTAIREASSIESIDGLSSDVKEYIKKNHLYGL